MCVVKTDMELLTSPTKRHWTSRIFRQPVKPKLSRKITSSARLNLNRYWSKFEELLSTDKHQFGCAAAGLTNGAVNNQLITTDLTNEINENLANELRENNNGRCRNCTVVDFIHLQS